MRSPLAALPRAILLLLWLVILGHKLGSIPPLGKFFSPFEGFWRNAEIGKPGNEEKKLPALFDLSADPSGTTSGMSDSIKVEYDHRGVPHIFARDLSGVFFAQGYATARDRLWQMDVQSRAGLGRLSEVMGPNLIRFDLERRRMGMPASAKASWEVIRKDSLSRIALEAYSAGVNAWIGALRPADYPFEFKLLDYAPEPWTPLKSIALLKNMQWTLSKGSDDVLLTRTLAKLGPEKFAELFPLRNPGAEPIFPADLFPGKPRVLSQGTVAANQEDSPPDSTAPLTDTFFPRPQRGSGSDNFVLAGTRTTSGYPILGNDPHLDLTLPSIWYESQLQGGGVDAYGVSIPGLPSLVIGFNAHIAWGVTNGMDDVFDWYGISFQDSSLGAYWWNGAWRPTRFVLDTIPVRGSRAVVDTEVWTSLGPVPVKNHEQPFDKNSPVLHALRWTALDTSNEIGAFLRLLPAENYGDFRAAIRLLSCPSQNFIFADSGNIALVHQGRIPIKRPDQGLTVIENDSSTASTASTSYDWRGYIPDSFLPFALNPKQGWLASANQEVTDSTYPFYLGSGFYPSERAGRLHRLLQPMQNATLSSAWDIMMNTESLHAEQTLPLLLRCIDSVNISLQERQALGILRGWDYRYLASSTAPALFDLWWKNFYRHTWEDKFEGDTLHYAWPSRPVTRALLASDTNSAWFDDTRTPQHETAGDLARVSFQEAVQQSLQMGAGTFVLWSRFHPMSIPHLLRLPSLGAGVLSGDGCAECLNAQRGSNGPSWRMAVEMDSTPVALGGYPGGQSGNPGSPNYDVFVADWLMGRPYHLLFLKRPGDEPDSIAYSLTLIP